MMALAQVSVPEIEYRLRIDPLVGEAMQVHLQFEIEGDQDGETLLRLPSEWGGESELWRGIADLRVEGGSLRPADPAIPDERRIDHTPGAGLVVRWQVIQDRDGSPHAAARDNYRPWLQADYLHLLGETILIRPELDDPAIGDDTSVTFRFDAPEGFVLASDLDFGDLKMKELGPSVIVGGDFRVTTRWIDEAPLSIAVRGDIVDDQIAAAAGLAVRGNLDYWTAEAEPYLVTALPVEAEPGRSSFGGTNLGDAFAIFGTDNVPGDIVLRTLVHEHAHTWVPSRLGGMNQGPEQPGDYWFSEGFTDFVTTRAGLLAGAWDAEAAVAQWNEFLNEYMANPEREAPNGAIRDGFWTSPALNRLPYVRGNLFAALLDHRIRTESRGAQDLDDVLFAMHADADRGPAADVLVEMVREVTGVDVSELHRRHIVEGKTIFLPADTFGSCGAVYSGMEPVFVYGLTLVENPDGAGFLIEAVDPDGPAAPAGFEAGMIIEERLAGAFGDATRDSVFRVRDASGAERVLSYRPTNGEEAMVQRIVPDDDALTSPECLERLAGRAL
jgi:predicted metalloprotease with PDZ domain